MQYSTKNYHSQENMQKAADETNAWNFRKVGEYNDKGELLNVYLNASDAARQIGILPGSMRNTIRRNGKCFNGLMYKYFSQNQKRNRLNYKISDRQIEFNSMNQAIDEVLKNYSDIKILSH